MSPATDFSVQHPKCKGCIHLGPTFPCEYILNTGHSPQSQGVRPADYTKGGCPLKEIGEKQIVRAAPMVTRRHRRIDSERCMALYRDGLSDADIAKVFGVKPSSVCRWREVRGLPSMHPNRRKATDEQYLELYAKGLSDYAVAKELGVSATSARSWRNRRGMPPNHPRGSY